jgi:hypothetical protein
MFETILLLCVGAVIGIGGLWVILHDFVGTSK